MVELVRSPRQADSAEAESFCCEQLRMEHAGINSSSILTVSGYRGVDARYRVTGSVLKTAIRTGATGRDPAVIKPHVIVQIAHARPPAFN